MKRSIPLKKRSLSLTRNARPRRATGDAANTLLTSIAAQFAGFGKTERGVEIALQNPDPNEQMAALSQIAQILIVQKDDKQARETVNLDKRGCEPIVCLVGPFGRKGKIW